MVLSNLKSSCRSMRFRETQPMCCAYKIMDLDRLGKENPLLIYPVTLMDVQVYGPVHGRSCNALIRLYDYKNDTYVHGVGTVRGCGFHLVSAAIQDAFESMGIVFDRKEAFDGVGTAAQEKAIMAVVKALGYTNTFKVDFYP